jgi:hypothetical protein
VLAELITRQAGMTDTEYSQRLGIPRSTWTNTRLGILPLGPRVIGAALRLWPDLREEALAWLAAHPDNTEAAG